MTVFPISPHLKGRCVQKPRRFIRVVGAFVFMPVRFSRTCTETTTFHPLTRTRNTQVVTLRQHNRYRRVRYRALVWGSCDSRCGEGVQPLWCRYSELKARCRVLQGNSKVTQISPRANKEQFFYSNLCSQQLRQVCTKTSLTTQSFQAMQAKQGQRSSLPTYEQQLQKDTWIPRKGKLHLLQRQTSKALFRRQSKQLLSQGSSNGVDQGGFYIGRGVLFQAFGVSYVVGCVSPNS